MKALRPPVAFIHYDPYIPKSFFVDRKLTLFNLL